VRRSLAALAAVLALAGCRVGGGTGEAFGEIFILECSDEGNYCTDGDVCGTPGNPVPFRLQPEFFAGEPIDAPDSVLGVTMQETNRLSIRLQRSGKRIEQNDMLTFTVADSYEVARCVRGRVLPSGEPDYDVRYCHHATPDSPAKIRITSQGGIVLASLSPRLTCSRNVVAEAFDEPSIDETVPIPTDGNFDSWITFEYFGDASLDPDGPPIKQDFKVELGQRVRAFGNPQVASAASGFHLRLIDAQVNRALRLDLPVPNPSIGGSLDGNFDFDLARGQGAQTFP
jgi:hypothetical protein